jgi:hypothetical protein
MQGTWRGNRLQGSMGIDAEHGNGDLTWELGTRNHGNGTQGVEYKEAWE